MQRMARPAQLLGASTAESRALATVYWQSIYPDDSPGYTSSECHNGGLLDLRPRDPVWP